MSIKDKYGNLTNKTLKKNSATYLKNKDVFIDQLKQLQEVIDSNIIDYLKLEGNLGGSDFI